MLQIFRFFAFFQTSQHDHTSRFLGDVWWKVNIVNLDFKILYKVKWIFSTPCRPLRGRNCLPVTNWTLMSKSSEFERWLPSFAILSLNLPWHDTDLNAVFWKAVAKFQGHRLGMSWLTGMLAGTLCAEGNFCSARTLKAPLEGRPRYPPSFTSNKSNENKHTALLPIKAQQ